MSDPFKNKNNKSPETLKHFYTQSNEDVNKGFFIEEFFLFLFKLTNFRINFTS